MSPLPLREFRKPCYGCYTVSPLEVTVSHFSLFIYRADEKPTQTPITKCSKVYTPACCSTVRSFLISVELCRCLFSRSWEGFSSQQLCSVNVSWPPDNFISNKRYFKPLHLSLMCMLLHFILSGTTTRISVKKKSIAKPD